MDKEHTIKLLKDAITFHQREQHHAATLWIAEQHREREKAIRSALAVVEERSNAF